MQAVLTEIQQYEAPDSITISGALHFKLCT
jgi:hypothetical protein